MMFLGLYGFVFFGLFSPGPNVILLTTSGARFGFHRTLPHIFGVALGVGVIAALTGLGVGVILQGAPKLVFGLKILASFWIAYMAWRLWTSRPADPEQANDQPFTFVQAVLFQWVNPKVWAVALSATAYTVGLDVTAQAIRLGVTFSTINLGVCLFWACAGTLLAQLLNDISKWRLFMRIMAIALLGFSLLVFL